MLPLDIGCYIWGTFLNENDPSLNLVGGRHNGKVALKVLALSM